MAGDGVGVKPLNSFLLAACQHQHTYTRAPLCLVPITKDARSSPPSYSLTPPPSSLSPPTESLVLLRSAIPSDPIRYRTCGVHVFLFYIATLSAVLAMSAACLTATDSGFFSFRQEVRVGVIPLDDSSPRDISVEYEVRPVCVCVIVCCVHAYVCSPRCCGVSTGWNEWRCDKTGLCGSGGMCVCVWGGNSR